MKALIIEIHKNHCIVLTSDGRFLKMYIPAGLNEIGDEVVIDGSDLYCAKERRGIFKIAGNIAIGFAAIAIIITGSYFGMQYLKNSGTNTVVAVAEADLVKSEAATAQDADIEAITDDSELQAVFESDDQPEGTISALPDDRVALLHELHEGIYSLDKKNVEFVLDFDDIKIAYKIIENKEATFTDALKNELFFNFLSNKKDHVFNGIISTAFSDMRNITTKTVTYIFDDFHYGHQKTETVLLQEDENVFKLTVYGQFD